MTKLTLLGAAAIVATALATPAMSQEATQEPGMIGFNYPNSNYLRGGYGVRTPSRHDHSYYDRARTTGLAVLRSRYAAARWARGRRGGRCIGTAAPSQPRRTTIPTHIMRGRVIGRAGRAHYNKAAVRPLFCWPF